MLPDASRAAGRREEEAPRYHKFDALIVKLNMTTQFRYSGANQA